MIQKFMDSTAVSYLLHKLWDNRYLGKEPEVRTVTHEHSYIPNQKPVAGTYSTEQEVIDAFDTGNDTELPLPLFVYGPEFNVGLTVDECDTEILATIQYKRTYTENVDAPTTLYGSAELPEDIRDVLSRGNYDGYVIGYSTNMWICQKYPLNNMSGIYYYSSESEAVTETSTEDIVTKRPVAQKFLPNADWAQNDPQGEGYVEGRTHWTETGVTDVIPKAGTYNSLEELQTELNSIEPTVVYVCDAYPEGFSYSFPAELGDYVGEPIAVLDKEFNVDGLRVLGPSSWDGDVSNIPEYLFIFKTEPYYQANTVMDVNTGKYYRWKAVAEIVHKLDRKFYDYNEPYDDTNCLKKTELQITHHSHDIEVVGVGTRTNEYDKMTLPNGVIIANIQTFLHINNGSIELSLDFTGLDNREQYMCGTALVYGQGVLFFEIYADGATNVFNPNNIAISNGTSVLISQAFMFRDES